MLLFVEKFICFKDIVTDNHLHEKCPHKTLFVLVKNIACFRPGQIIMQRRQQDSNLHILSDGSLSKALQCHYAMPAKRRLRDSNPHALAERRFSGPMNSQLLEDGITSAAGFEPARRLYGYWRFSKPLPYH